jgi:hypothetical protein
VRAIWTVEESQDLASTIRFYGSSKEIKIPGRVQCQQDRCTAVSHKAARIQTTIYQGATDWFLPVRFFMVFSIHRKFFGFAITWFFKVVFNCYIIKQRNMTDSSTACLSVADIAGCATWAAGLLAATLAVDLLLIYYPHRAQLGVMGDAVRGDAERRISHLGDKREAGELDSIPAVVESAKDTTAVLAVGRQRMAVATEISYLAIQLSDVQRCIRAQLLHVWFHSPQDAQLTATREGEEAGPYQDQLCSGC